LLLSDQPTWTVHLDDQDYPTYDATLVAYLAQPDGRLRERPVYGFHESLPTIRGIAPQAPEPITGARSGGPPRNRHTGIKFVSCGQFEVVYYWQGRRFEHAEERP
jgi:hypothetical protein